MEKENTEGRRASRGTGSWYFESLRKLYAVTFKEMQSYFFSPMAWAVFAIVFLLLGWMFYSMSVQFSIVYAKLQQARSLYPNIVLNVNKDVFGPLFTNFAVVLLLVMPVVTMRLFSEEYAQGTMELLLTRPLSVGEIVLGKFLAAVGVLVVMLGASFLYPLLLNIYATGLDFGPIWAGYLGLLGVGASFIAIGMFASSFTDKQIIAAAVSFGLNLFFWIVGWFDIIHGGESSAAARIARHLCLNTHLQGFIKGTIDSSDLVFFAALVFFFLYLTYVIVDSMRWR